MLGCQFTYISRFLSKDEFLHFFLIQFNFHSMNSFDKRWNLYANRQPNLSYDITYMQQFSRIFDINKNYNSCLFVKNKFILLAVRI